MYFKTVLAIASIVSMTCAAPVSQVNSTLDAGSLLKNGQEAQRLNSLFKTLNATDACNDGDSACISGAIGQCVNKKWDIARGKCASSQQCFAIPSVRQAGVLLACTTESNALAVINKSGATGGLFGNTTTTEDGDGEVECNHDPAPDTEPNGECTEDPTSTSTGTSSGTSTSTSSGTPTNTQTATVTAPATVTVTVFPSQFTSQTTVTTTLSPQEASSILSSISAAASSSSQAAASTSVAASAPAITLSAGSSSVSTSASASSSPLNSAPATIRLTAAPAPSAATSAAVSATPSPSAAAAGVGGYNY